MTQSTHAKKRLDVIDTLVFAISALLIIAIFLTLHTSFPDYFKFGWNPYAILPAIEVLVLTGLLVALFLKKGHLQARIWFSILLVGGIALGVGEFMMRISGNDAQAMFWSSVSIAGLSVVPLGFYMFTHFFIGGNDKKAVTIAPVVITVTGGALLIVTVASQTIEMVRETTGPWGYSIPISLSFLIMTLWLGLVVLVCAAKFFRYMRKTSSIIHKQQAKLIVVGALGSVSGGLLLDVIPRFMDIRILPIGVLLQTLLPLSVLYALYRYDKFTIDFSATAADILDTLSEAVLVTDKSFKVRMINAYGLELLDYKEADIIDQPVVRLFASDRIKPFINNYVQSPSLSASKPVTESQVLTSKGEKVDVSISLSQLRGSSPTYIFVLTNISNVKKFYAIEQQRNAELEAANKAFSDQQRAMINLLEDSRDLGEQLRHEKEDVERKVEQRTKEVQAERTRLEASINSLDIGFIIIDNDNKTVTSNQALRNILDISSETDALTISMVGKKLEDSFKLQSIIDVCMKKGTTVTKDEILYKTKELRLFMAPVFDDSKLKKCIGAVILLEDVSEAKSIQRSRDEFFSIASHELRTPLTAIRGNTKMIIDYYKEQLSDPMLVEMVDDIHDSSIRLITIVNDFLDTSRLEQGKISFELTEFDAAELIKDIAQEFKAGGVNPDLYIKIKVPLAYTFVLADRDRLKQSVINLVGNAFKFTEKGGVTITLKPVKNNLHIEVADTGKGVPEESQSLLFRKFQQASNNILTRDSTRSTGLGLYISKLIMEGMNGKIYLKSSEVGKGSVFTVEVPLAPVNQKAATAGEVLIVKKSKKLQIN